MTEWLEPVQFWHWWVLGLLLIIFEVLSPAVFFLWMGIAAGVVGLALMAMPQLHWSYQLFLFAVVSVASIVGWRAYLKRHPTDTDRPTLNRRGEQYVGRTFTLAEPMVHGRGRIRVDDTMWKIEGEDCPAGCQVKVVGADGVILKVEAYGDG